MSPVGPERAEAFSLALGALRRRERTVAEMRAWLEARDLEVEVIDAAIEQLGELGELDDERFARRFAEDKRELSGWGAERIRQTLEARGVEPRLAEAVSAEDGDAARERAAQLLRARLEPIGDDGARRRALGFLLRRGYESETAYAAVRDVAAERAA